MSEYILIKYPNNVYDTCISRHETLEGAKKAYEECMGFGGEPILTRKLEVTLEVEDE